MGTIFGHILSLSFLPAQTVGALTQKDPWAGVGGTPSWLHLRVASYTGVTSKFPVTAMGWDGI